MLGDNPEKSRNPLKKAMRRRNVKTVTFTDPTYYEADPEEYSSDEEGDEEPEFITTADAARNGNDQQQAQQAQDAQAQQNQNEAAKVEPLRIRSVSQRDQQSDQAVNGSGGDDQPKADPRIDRPRASEESMESTGRRLMQFELQVLTHTKTAALLRAIAGCAIRIPSTRMRASRPGRSASLRTSSEMILLVAAQCKT